MNCKNCARPFVSDRTPMAEAGYCLFCRPAIEVVCARCGEACPGAFDGQEKCARCRSARLGEQQYEDKQRAQFLAWQAAGGEFPVIELREIP
jgi:hypothetical protein